MAFQNVQGGPAINAGVTWRGNEPGGYTLESDQPFDSLPSNGWAGFFTWSIVSDAGGIKSPSNAFQILYPAGYGGGDSPGMAECGLANRKKFYACMAVKYSSNFQGHLTGVNKIIHIWLNGANRLFLLGDGSGSNNLEAAIGLQSVTSSPYGTSAQVDPTIVAGAHFIRGQWHQLEVVAIGNSAGTANGSVDLYLDGVHVSSITGIQWTSAATTFEDVKLDPTWGGLADTVSADQSIRCDHIYMSSSN